MSPSWSVLNICIPKFSNLCKVSGVGWPYEFFPDDITAISGLTFSKKIVEVSIKNDLTTATYTADFEKAEDISVEVTFKKINDQMKVIGLWLK